MAVCKDCAAEGITTNRPAPNPGPRCTTHWRAEKKRRSTRAHDNRIQSVYGIDEEQYAGIVAAQGGKCAICQRATGATRRMSVDHNHNLGCGHDPKQGCPKCVRGILCRPCNDLLGHARDDVAMLLRAVAYLTHPPARKVLQ